MEKRFISVAAVLVIVFVTSKTMGAEVAAVFIDDFNTPHRYHDPIWGPNVSGTIWDDYVGWGECETVNDLTTTHPNHFGQLYMASTNGNWAAAPWCPLGPFLYKVVKGDFIATVEVADYAYTPDTQLGDYLHNTCGLMARASRDPDVAGPGEDWVAIDYFPIWYCGNFVRVADNNEGGDVAPNGKYRRPLDTLWPEVELCDPYLRLERKGNTFIINTSADGNEWEEHGASPIERPDFDGLPVQVGLRQCTFSTNYGWVAFDNFKLELIVEYKAHNPAPDDESEHAPIDINLTWSSGAEFKYHDVYFGTNETEVLNASRPVGDVDGNGEVNWLDLFVVRQQWLGVPPGGSQRSADLTGDGKINGFDFAIAADDWGKQASDVFKGSQFTNSYNPGTLNYGTTYYWRIDEVNDPNFWTGDVWSFTVAKLEATDPSPANGAECVPVDTELLSWTPGAKARTILGHKVYFGTSSPPGFVGIVSEPNWPLPELEYDTNYYWRVDELNSPNTWPGDEWSFRTVCEVSITDPNLVGWWKLDGSSCENIAFDSSGYDHHGTLVNGPEFIAPGTMPCGLVGALSFDGEDDYVEFPIGTLISSLTNSTFMMWVDSKPGGRWVRAFDFSAEDPNFYMCLGPRWWFMDDMYFGITTTGTLHFSNIVQPTGFDLPAELHHVAVTINADTNTAVLYYDGYELAHNNHFMLSPSDLGETVNNWLGRSHDADDDYYVGSMADFRIYNYTMTAEDVTTAMGCIIHP